MDSNELKPVGPTQDAIEITTSLTAKFHVNLSELISFVGSAAKIDAHAIGFITFAAYEEAHARNRIIILRRNNDLCGFILYSLNRQRECRILQIWVRADARIIEHGRALIDWLEKEIADTHNCWCLRCWVAQDLESNLFWQAMHFEYLGWRWGPAKNPRKHNLYRRLTSRALATLHASPSPTQQATHPLPIPPSFYFSGTMVTDAGLLMRPEASIGALEPIFAQ